MGTNRTARPAATLLAVVGISALLAAPAASHGHSEVTRGTFTPTAAGIAAGFDDLAGRVQMERTADDTTRVHVHVTGLEAGVTYPSHVHDAPCDTGGGGHYKHDPSGPTTPPNELWPDSPQAGVGITANAAGVGNANASAPWRARPEAQSVVIHAGGGTRIACADLT
ncbi:MAG: superoxide dismutase family protein [Actinobacteria bacterium]|nr:superoxide dismutase family protein [Actinomycetota bacterium]